MNKMLIDFLMRLGCCLAFFFLFIFSNISGFSQTKKPTEADENKIKAVPRIERGECAVPIPANEKAECGYLIVYEDRRANKDRTIRLPFITMKSESANPLPDPILYTSGGPGSSSLGQVRNRRYIPYLKNRDYILFEQRGTKYAQPSLQCPEVNDARLYAAKRNLTKSDSVKAELEAVRACREKLQSSGVNLSAYNSAASAADIEDLRRLLGYEKWNLYGISYSTRLMLTVMRYYPDGIRSVLLDSVLPPSVNYDETSVDSVIRSLNLIFTACKADAECNTAYPNLEKQFYSLVQKLDAKPIFIDVTDSQTKTTTKLLLDGSDIVNGVYSALETGYKLASLPSLISRAEQNDNQALMTLAKTKLDVSSFAWGMRYSVWCVEEMPFQNRGLIKNQITTKYPRLAGFGIQSNFPAICDIWKVKPADKIENELVKSNIPTLVLAGEYDPDTPTTWGKLAAQTLMNSRFFELRGMSHVPTFGSTCAQELATAFFNNSQTDFDSQCVKNMPALKFEVIPDK